MLEKAATFADSNPNLILTVTRHGGIAYANRSVERMLLKLGLPAQHYEILLPDRMEEIVEGILSGEEKERPVGGKTMGRAINYTVIRLEEGDAVGFFGMDWTGEPREMEDEKALRRAGREAC